MLRLVQIEEIESLMLLLPGLIKQQAQRSSDFVSKVSEWLTSMETALAANRIHQAGNIAAIRSGLVAAAQGHTPLISSFAAVQLVHEC